MPSVKNMKCADCMGYDQEFMERGCPDAERNKESCEHFRPFQCPVCDRIQFTEDDPKQCRHCETKWAY